VPPPLDGCIAIVYRGGIARVLLAGTTGVLQSIMPYCNVRRCAVKRHASRALGTSIRFPVRIVQSPPHLFTPDHIIVRAHRTGDAADRRVASSKCALGGSNWRKMVGLGSSVTYPRTCSPTTDISVWRGRWAAAISWKQRMTVWREAAAAFCVRRRHFEHLQPADLAGRIPKKIPEHARQRAPKSNGNVTNNKALVASA